MTVNNLDSTDAQQRQINPYQGLPCKNPDAESRHGALTPNAPVQLISPQEFYAAVLLAKL